MKSRKITDTYLLAMIGIALIFISGCKKDKKPTIAVGDNYQGGIVAYILVPGDPGYEAGKTHGLIAASSDQSVGITWGSGSTVTGATASALGTGIDNTITVFNNQGAGNYAAKLCYDLVLGGYNDWFLPSKDELNKLFLNKQVIGGFADKNYWSSSEGSVAFAWSQSFSTGNQFAGNKISAYNVRAVRAF